MDWRLKFPLKPDCMKKWEIPQTSYIYRKQSVDSGGRIERDCIISSCAILNSAGWEKENAQIIYFHIQPCAIGIIPASWWQNFWFSLPIDSPRPIHTHTQRPSYTQQAWEEMEDEQWLKRKWQGSYTEMMQKQKMNRENKKKRLRL